MFDEMNIKDLLFFYRDMFVVVFYILLDFDDIFVNIGFGLLLKEILGYSDLFVKWYFINLNFILVLYVLKRYVYRFYFNNICVNIIDFRIYFYFYKFLVVINKIDVVFVLIWVR